jgi:hypothetical protein
VEGCKAILFEARKGPLRTCQTALGGQVHELGVGLEAGLDLDHVVVVLNRLQAEIEVLGDLFVGGAGCDLPEDLDLALGKLIERGA